MRVRVPVLLTAALTAGLTVMSVVPASAGATPAVPSAAGDMFEMTAQTRPVSVSRPAGSLVLRGGETALRSASPGEVRLSGTDSASGATVRLGFTAPAGKIFQIKGRTGRGDYPIAPHGGGRTAGATASWNGSSCVVGSGDLTITALTSGPGGVTRFEAHYQLLCQAGTQLQGLVRIGFGDEVRYSSALATGVGPRDLGSLAVGSTTRVELPFTYHGVPVGEQYPAGALTWVTTTGRPVSAPGVTVVDDGCASTGFTEGVVCTVVVDVHPTSVGPGNFFIGLGSSIGGYTAVVYTVARASG